MSKYLMFGNFVIPAYGLMMTVGIFLSGFFIILRAKQNKIESEEMIIVMAISVGTAIFGAGFLYILVSYSARDIVNSILNGNFDFLKSGGLVFYGGLIGGLSGAIFVVKWRNIDVKSVEKCIVPILPLGHAIGRVGCLLAGCCYGFEYTGFFAVKNFNISYEKTYFPIQLLEALFNIGIMYVLLLYARKKRDTYSILCFYMILYSVVRFLLEFLRGDIIRGMFFSLSTSQWISIIIFLGCTFVLCIRRIKK